MPNAIGVKLHHLFSKSTLLIFWVSGCVSVLVDADHIPYTLGWMENGRPLHMLWGIVSCVGGLLLLMVLRSTSEKGS